MPRLSEIKILTTGQEKEINQLLKQGYVLIHIGQDGKKTTYTLGKITPVQPRIMTFLKTIPKPLLGITLYIASILAYYLTMIYYRFPEPLYSFTLATILFSLTTLLISHRFALTYKPVLRKTEPPAEVPEKKKEEETKTKTEMEKLPTATSTGRKTYRVKCPFCRTEFEAKPKLKFKIMDRPAGEFKCANCKRTIAAVISEISK